jgi:hypothetical protein
MQRLIRRGYSNYMMVVAVTGIVTGLYLYWRVSGGFQPDWIGSPFGATITIGAVTAIAAFALGPLFYLPAGKRIEAITRGMGPTGPNPEQGAELRAITHHLTRVGNWSMVLLGITVLTMAGARYVGTVLP